MKKKILTVFLIFFSTFLFAGENLVFSFKPNFSIKEGQVKEWVVLKKTEGKYKPISQLDWDVHALITYGLDFQMNYRNCFCFSISSDFGIPGKSGFLQDYDRMNAKQKDESVNWITHYSKHENEIFQFNDLFLELGCIFNPSEKISLIPFLGANFNFFDFRSYNGYVQYATSGSGGIYEEWKESLEKKYLDGKVVTYKIYRLFENLGVSLQYRGDRLDYGVKLSYSPFSLCVDRDFHWKRNILFTDFMINYGFAGVGLKQNLDFSFTENFKAGLFLDFSMVPLSIGLDYSSAIGSHNLGKPDPVYSGGSSSSMFTMGISVTLSF